MKASSVLVKDKLALIASVCLWIGSWAICITGFVQAYTFDAEVSSRGAPASAGISGLIGILLVIEVFCTHFFTSPWQAQYTLIFRQFIYLSTAFFGFLAMCFYAAPYNQVEPLASVGAAFVFLEAILGASLLQMKIQASKISAGNDDLKEGEIIVHKSRYWRRCCASVCCVPAREFGDGSAEKNPTCCCCETCCCGRCACVCTRRDCGSCCSMCLRWTLWTFCLLFFVQAACILADNQRYLIQGSGTDGISPTIVSVTVDGASYTESNPLRLCIHCIGEKNLSQPTILLEAGGGSGFGSMYPLQRVLVNTHRMRVCSYDRAGYGFSQSGDPFVDAKRQAGEIYNALVNIREFAGPKGFVCAGHSAGASACRRLQYYYPANVSGIVTLDGYCNTGNCNIEKVWNIADGSGANLIKNTFAMRLTMVDLLRWFAPFALTRIFLGGSGLQSANHGGNMAWNQQYFDFRPSLNDTARDEFEERIFWTRNILGPLPLLVVTAGQNKTCEQAGQVNNEWGQGCTKHLQRQNATLFEVIKYVETSDGFGRSTDCGVKCDHGFVQAAPGLTASYVMQVTNAVIYGNWTN